MFIDVHGHLGLDRAFDEEFLEEDLLWKTEKYGVDLTIVQPGTVHTLEEVVEQHDAIADLCRRFPCKFVGMANPNPHLKDADYEKEIRRCIEDLKFVGIKIHPAAHGVNPAGRDGLRVFALARELHVPVMVHTGTGLPFSSPAHAIPISQAYPDVSIVLAHSGMMVLAPEAGIALANCDNVYADLSWTMGQQTEAWVKKFGAHRFMFASDHAVNCGPELKKIEDSGLNQEEKNWILYASAMKVYNLPMGKE